MDEQRTNLPGSVEHRLALLFACATVLAQDERLDYADRHWCKAVASGADKMLMEGHVDRSGSR